MEILRKRSYNISDDENSRIVHKHMEFGNVGQMEMTASDEYNLPQKRMCNGVSGYLSEANHAMECISVGCPTQPSETDDDAVAMRTSSCHPHIPINSMQSSHHVMTPGGDATSIAVSPHIQRPDRRVCQRCLSGEPGHITHIVR